MTVVWVHAEESGYARLWESSVFDSGCAFATLLPSDRNGRGFADALATLLTGCGRVQPSNNNPRKATRADLGRLTVAARDEARDLVLFEPMAITHADAHLLGLLADRSARQVWLIGSAPAEPQLAGWLAAHAVEVGCDEAVDVWARRPSAGGRREKWPCAAALDGGDADCPTHRRASDCLLAWYPHALATARTTSAAVRAALFEALTCDPEARWGVWARARDHYPGLVRAADLWDAPWGQLDAAAICDLSDDGATLALDGESFAVPSAHRSLVRTHRDVLVADGFARESRLFQVALARPAQYAIRRPGDAPGRVA